MKDMLKDYYKSLNVDERVFEYCNSVEEKLKDRFAKIDAVSEINQLKVLKAMQDNRLSEAHFAGSSGYGCCIVCLNHVDCKCIVLAWVTKTVCDVRLCLTITTDVIYIQVKKVIIVLKKWLVC